MKLFPPTLIFVLATAVIANSVLAQEAQDPDLKSLDKNSDDKISIAEFEAYAESRLPDFEQLELFAKKVDGNSNGEISADEFSNRMAILEKIRRGEFDDGEVDPALDSEKSNADKKATTVPASKDQSSVNEAYTKIKELIKKNDWQSAANLMTSEAADRTAAQLVTNGLGMSKIELPMRMPDLEEAIDEINTVLHKYGLDKLGIETEPMLKIQIGTYEEDEEESNAEESDTKAKAKQKQDSAKIIAALDQDGKRWQIVGELWEAFAASPFGANPLVGKVDTISVTGDQAVVEVNVMPKAGENDQPGMTVQILAPPVYLDFQKSNGDWKYAGVNEQKSDAARKDFDQELPLKNIKID